MPSRTAFLRATSGVLAAAACLLAAPGAAAITADYSHTPVLMVHGYFVIDDAGDATWAVMKKHLVDDGWPEEYIDTPSFDDVRGCDPEHAQQIAIWVDALKARTGFDKVDIVCHSEGCLNTLHYLKDLCGVANVRQFVGLAGAVHGTTTACVDAWSCGAAEMCIGSEVNGWKDNASLVALQAWDETPGDVQYTSIWSDYDEIIHPPSGSELYGAHNIEVATDWVEHAGIFLCAECYQHVHDALTDGGWNDDGPGWEHLMQCAPPEVVDPPPETAEEADGADATDAAVAETTGDDGARADARTGDAATDLPAGTDPGAGGDAAGADAAGTDRGGATDAATADGTVAADGADAGATDAAPPAKVGGGCAAGTSSGRGADGTAGLAVAALLLAGLARVARRRA